MSQPENTFCCHVFGIRMIRGNSHIWKIWDHFLGLPLNLDHQGQMWHAPCYVHIRYNMLIKHRWEFTIHWKMTSASSLKEKCFTHIHTGMLTYERILPLQFPTVDSFYWELTLPDSFCIGSTGAWTVYYCSLDISQPQRIPARKTCT